MTNFIVNDYLYIHGGRDLKEGPMGNMWRLSISGVQELNDDPDYGVAWELISCKGHLPGNIAYHKPVVFGHKVLIFGGTIDDNSTTEAYEFDSNKFIW